MKGKIGVLVFNLGTPDSYEPSDVRRYLNEFLTDRRVIDIPAFRRQLLVRGIIVPLRYKAVAKKYEEIWLKEGAPLLVYSLNFTQKLQAALGDDYIVELGMRYQNNSVKTALAALRKKQVSEIIIFPLYPQYASSTTGTAYELVMNEMKNWYTIPPVRTIHAYYDHPAFIRSWAIKAKQYDLSAYDHILFSYHGLPVRHLKEAYPDNQHCYVKEHCCDAIVPENQFCYKAHCMASTKKIVDSLGLQPGTYSICFQSRLGKDEWIQPYLSDVLQKMIDQGKKKLLVFSPAFVTDCLETIHEISIETKEEFLEMGGASLELVSSLNDEEYWVEAAKEIILQ